MNFINNISSVFRNTTVKNGLLFTIYSFLNSGINFLLLIIIAKFVDPEGYGHLNLFNTALNLFGYFICMNTAGMIAINFFKKSAYELKQTINAVFITTIICYIILLLCLALFNSTITRLFGLSPYLQIGALTLCFTDVFSKIILDIWRSEEKVVSYGFFCVGKVVVNFSLTILLVVVLKYDWYGQVFSYIACGLIFFVISLLALYRKNYLRLIKPSKEHFKEILSFGIPLIPHNASFWLRQGLDRVFLNTLQNTATVGLFCFSMNFANIIQIIGSAFNATNSVFIYKNLASEDENIKRKLQKQTILMIICFVMLGACVCIGCSVFIPMLYPRYSGCVIYLILQCMGSVCQCIYLLFVNFLFYYKKTKVLMYITFSISVFHALFSWWLTRYGADITAIIGFASNFAIMLGVYLYSRKIYKLF